MFRSFSTRYFGVYQFFVRNCGIGSPPPPQCPPPPQTASPLVSLVDSFFAQADFFLLFPQFGTWSRLRFRRLRRLCCLTYIYHDELTHSVPRGKRLILTVKIDGKFKNSKQNLRSKRGNCRYLVQKVDNAIHQINHYPLDSAIGFPNTYPLDKAIHLSGAIQLLTGEILLHTD